MEDQDDSDCCRPCKRKRTSSCTVQDISEVKVQTEGDSAQDVSERGDAEDVNLLNNRLFQGESFEAQYQSNEQIHNETCEQIHVPICIRSAANFDDDLIMKHGSVSSIRYRETPYDISSSSDISGSSLDFRDSGSDLRCSDFDTTDFCPSTSQDRSVCNSNEKLLERKLRDEQNFDNLQEGSSFSVTSSSSCQEILPCNKNTSFCINKLPPSILVQIFCHLSLADLLKRASLVCRTWYQLSHDPELWRIIDLRPHERVTDSALMTLTSYSDRVMYLDLTHTKELSCEGIKRVMKKCKHLQTLKLSRFFPLTDDVLEVIGGSCPKLQCLFLEFCFRITNEGIKKVAEGCPDLRELQLTQCKTITDDGVIVLAEKCHQLKQLMVDHCGWLTDKSVIELTVGCPLLEYLSLTTCNLTDRSIQEIKKLENLKGLDISSIPSITPAAILQVMKNCKLLECINLSLNPLVNDECIEMVAKYGNNLKRLYCVSCTLSDKGLEMIGQNSKTIQHLDVGWCCDVTDEGVRKISSSCPTLQYLRCDNVTIETMEELVERYPHIEYSTFVFQRR